MDDHYVLFPPVDRVALNRRAARESARRAERRGGHHVVRPRVCRLMVDIRVIPPRALRSLTGMHRVPDITLDVGETHDMSQYIGDGVVTDTSQILNLNPAVATYDNATKLLTGVTAGLLSGLQYEVTTVVAALLHGDPLSITGDSYGARRGDLQEIFEKFDGGTLEGAWTDTGGLVPTTTKPRHIRQTYSAESDFKIVDEHGMSF